MKKIWLSLVIAFLYGLGMYAEGSFPNNSVFPVLNTVSDNPEFTVCGINTTYEHDGKRVYTSDVIRICKFGEMTTFDIKHSGSSTSYVSFNYVTYNKSNFSNEWNHGSQATQFAFHPGGMSNVNYSDSESPLTVPMYAFTYNFASYDFNLVNLADNSVVATLYNGDILSSVFLTVFAGKDRNTPDIIVIAGKDKYTIYGTFVENGSSGVRQIFSSDKEPTYFGINGQKYDDPQPGLNIVVDGNKTKKIVVK